MLVLLADADGRHGSRIVCRSRVRCPRTSSPASAGVRSAALQTRAQVEAGAHARCACPARTKFAWLNSRLVLVGVWPRLFCCRCFCCRRCFLVSSWLFSAAAKATSGLYFGVRARPLRSVVECQSKPCPCPSFPSLSSGLLLWSPPVLRRLLSRVVGFLFVWSCHPVAYCYSWVEAVFSLVWAVVSVQHGAAAMTECGLIPALLNVVQLNMDGQVCHKSGSERGGDPHVFYVSSSVKITTGFSFTRECAWECTVQIGRGWQYYNVKINVRTCGGWSRRFWLLPQLVIVVLLLFFSIVCKVF